MNPYRQKIGDGYFRLPSTKPREADVRQFVDQFYKIHSSYSSVDSQPPAESGGVSSADATDRAE